MSSSPSSFVVANPGRGVCDIYARILGRHDRLRAYCTGTRRPGQGIPLEKARLLPMIGLLNFLGAKTLPPHLAESFRFSMHPLFDRLVSRWVKPGDHVISSYGYANATFRKARRWGGKTFLDAGNSHPLQFWEIISEEHRRWGSDLSPISPSQQKRAVEMMVEVDFAFSPSSYVTASLLEQGMKESQILPIPYYIDLKAFSPSPVPRPANRPFTVIFTGSLSLRKGTPYLLEAFRIVQRFDPTARLLLTRIVESSIHPILSRFHDLNIDWSDPLPHVKVADRLRQADIFVLPSLEDGFALTTVEALGCGLPAIVSTNTGASDYIRSGLNGEVTPIRSPEKIAQALLGWRDRVIQPVVRCSLIDAELFSENTIEEIFLGHLRRAGI